MWESQRGKKGQNHRTSEKESAALMMSRPTTILFVQKMVSG
ncbi:MAG: hypothetical protein ACXWEW_10140 [Nitrososphaeraceae archaeon]